MQPTGVLEKAKASKNPLQQLLDYGQSMWLDYIRRDLFTSGKLKQMIAEDGLRGMTSNPAIFEKAIADSSLYDDMLKSLASRKDLDATGRFEQLAIRDIQDAADALSTSNPTSATATSVWKSLRISRARRKRLWTKLGVSGRRPIARTS
jgi:transaldolase/glucose-6-phosphate isomerase